MFSLNPGNFPLVRLETFLLRPFFISRLSNYIPLQSKREKLRSLTFTGIFFQTLARVLPLMYIQRYQRQPLSCLS